MTGPKSVPGGESAPRPGGTWATTETYVDNDPLDTFGREDTFGPDMNQPDPPRPNRATRRAMQRAARRNK